MAERSILDEGGSAFDEGRQRTDNPYQKGSFDYLDWQIGFDLAKYQAENGSVGDNFERAPVLGFRHRQCAICHQDFASTEELNLHVCEKIG